MSSDVACNAINLVANQAPDIWCLQARDNGNVEKAVEYLSFAVEKSQPLYLNIISSYDVDNNIKTAPKSIRKQDLQQQQDETRLITKGVCFVEISQQIHYIYVT